MMRVRVSHDAASIAVGGLAVARALREVDAQVLRTGSRGLFWIEPLIEIETPSGWQAFGQVSAADVPSILESVRRGSPHALALGNIEEHPFLKRQTRLTFARCGTVDPASLDEYANTGGLQGLKRAIEIGPENIREEVTASGLRGRGGAGFPAGIKWNGAALASGGQKYVVC